MKPYLHDTKFYRQFLYVWGFSTKKRKFYVFVKCQRWQLLCICMYSNTFVEVVGHISSVHIVGKDVSVKIYRDAIELS